MTAGSRTPRPTSGPTASPTASPAAASGPATTSRCYLYNAIEYLEGMLAAFKLRAVPINVNYRYVEDELRYLLDDADVKAVVFHREFAPKLAADPRPAPRPRRRRRGRRRHPRRSHADLGAVDYEAALAGASPAARLRAPLGRRPLHPLHRRHDRHAQGRDVARTRTCSSARSAAPVAAASRSRRPRRSPSAALERRTRCVPACPFMHGTAHWMALQHALHRRHGGHLRRAPLRSRARSGELVAREQVNFLVIVGDAFARPLLEALDSLDGRDVDLSSLQRASSRAARSSRPR